MAAEIDGMRVVISADASQAIRTIQDFQMKFRNMANSINGTMMNANTNVNKFNDSISDIGSLTNIVQMQKMNDTLKGMNSEEIKNFLETNKNNDIKKRLQEEALKSIQRQEKSLEKNKKNWLAIGVASAVALFGIIKMSSLAGMWISELSQIFSFFLDTALLPLSPIIEGLLYVFWSLADWFSGLDPIIQGAVGALGLLGVAFGILTGFIAWLTGTTGLVVITGILEAIGGAIAFIISPIGLVIAAIIAVVAIAWYLYNNWDEVMALIGKLWDVAVTKVTTAWDGVKTYLLGVWDGIKNAVSTAWDSIKNIITGAVQNAYDTIVGIISKIKSAITSIPGVQSAINLIQGGYQTAKSYLGYAQGTDYVPATGIYKLHEGEQVIPKGGNSTTNNQSVVYNNTFTINNPVMKSDADVRQLAAQLSEYWKSDMTRYVRGTI